jgi:C4-dicarboxylate-specific signal transduction histidine kinase
LAQVSAVVATQQKYTGHVDRLEPVNLQQAVADVLRLEGEACRREGVRLVAELGEVPPIVTNKHKILLVLVNLLRNAADAVREGKPATPTVIVRLHVGNAGTIHLEVADNGVGITPGHAPRVFQYGFTTKATGHGFGLHSSILATEELGGRLSFSSPGPNQGATFVLALANGAPKP